MSLSAGGLGALALGSSEHMTVAGLADESGFAVSLAFICDATSEAARGLEMNVQLDFACDALVLGGVSKTRPTDWAADSAITTIWVPELKL